MNHRSRLLTIAALAAGIVAFLRRPVKPPEVSGTWQPADRQRATR